MHSSNKNDTTYKIIKLVNGETIIATLTSDDINEIEVQNPLLMNIIPHESEFGERESLNLMSLDRAIYRTKIFYS